MKRQKTRLKILRLTHEPDWNWTKLGDISPVLLKPIAEQCQQIGWTNTLYDRKEKTLTPGRRMLEFPFLLIWKRPYSDKEIELMEAARPFFESFKALFPEYLWVRAEFGVLEPNTTIPWHVDTNYTALNKVWNWHPFCSKLHIPLITNSNCRFLWEGDEECHMPVGAMYDFNHLKEHSATNEGSTIRIHLIVSIMHESLWDDLLKEMRPIAPNLVQRLKYGKDLIIDETTL